MYIVLWFYNYVLLTKKCERNSSPSILSSQLSDNDTSYHPPYCSHNYLTMMLPTTLHTVLTTIWQWCFLLRVFFSSRTVGSIWRDTMCHVTLCVTKVDLWWWIYTVIYLFQIKQLPFYVVWIVDDVEDHYHLDDCQYKSLV